MSKKDNPLDPKNTHSHVQEAVKQKVIEAAAASDGDVNVGIEALSTSLPEGLTIEHVEAAKAALHGAISGATLAQATHAPRVFKANPELQAVTIKVALGQDADLVAEKGDFVNVTTSRKKTLNVAGKPHTTYGSTNVDTQLQFARTGTGATGTARERVKAAVGEALNTDVSADKASD